jgi:ABC-type multidrug transport system fused ATPase/permease subunit
VLLKLLRKSEAWQVNRHVLALVARVPRRALWLGITAMVVSSILDAVSLGLMIPFLKLLLGEVEVLQLPTALPLAEVLNPWLATADKGTVIAASAGVLMASIALKSYCYFSALVLTTRYEEAVTDTMRERLFGTYLAAPNRFYDTHQLGTVTANLQQEVNSVGVMISYFFSVATSVLTLVAYMATLIVVSWRLTLLTIVLIGSVALGITFYLRSLKGLGDQALGLGRQLSVRILDTLGGIRVVRAFANEDYEFERFQDLSRRYRQARVSLRKKQHFLDPVTELATLGSAMIILVGGYTFLISRGLLGTSELMLFMLVLIRIIPVTKRINTARGYIQEHLSALGKVSEGLALLERFPTPPGEVPFSGFRDAIRFHDVRFSYNGRTEVLKGFDLEVPKGHTVALIGASGAGKSTLAALLPRFYEVDAGAITIDGRDIREFDALSLRRHIGIVSQDTYIFNTTIFANIAYGSDGATLEQVVEAARLANAHEFIQNLPRGYETVVGDRGVQLSGGQRQRISIARAILRDPEILILDEATSALDSQSEALVQEALERLRQNRTVVVIAHRLSTVRNADRIVVMEQGRIVESGEHHELIANRGAYWSYHRLQAATT